MKAFLTFDNKTVEVKADFSLSESNIVLNFENIQLSRAKDFTINKAELYEAGFKIEDFSIFGGRSLIGKTFDAQLQMGVNILEGSLSFSTVKKDEVSANFVYGNLDKLKAFKTLKVSDLDNTYDPDSSTNYVWDSPTAGDFLAAGAIWAGSNDAAMDFGSLNILLSRLLGVFATKVGINLSLPTDECKNNLYIYCSNQASMELYVATIPIAVKDVLKLETTAADLLKLYAAYTASYITYNASTETITLSKIDTFADSIVNIENYLVSFDEKLKSISDGVNRRLELKNSEDFYYLPAGTASFDKLLNPIDYGDTTWKLDLSTPIRCYDSGGENFKDIIPIFAPEYTDGTKSLFKLATNTWIASVNYPVGDERHVSGNEDTLVTAIPQNSKILETAKEEGVSIKTTILGNYDRFLELKNKTFEIFGQLFIWKSAQITENLINFELMKFRRWDIEYVPYFIPFVAPEDFTNPADFATYGLKVNLYEKFRVYKMTWASADIAVEFSDAISSVAFTAGQVPSGTTIEIFETVLGVETSVLRTTTGTHTFTSGSTKRYLIRRITSSNSFILPVGSVWAYCFGITRLTGYPGAENPYLKYVFFYENTLTGIGRFQNSSITGIVKLHNGITQLYGNTFYNCINIIQLITGNNLTTIGTYECFSCSNLKIVDLGTGIMSIGAQFINGAPIERFICRAVTPPSITSATLAGLPASARIEVPSGSVSSYKAATNWNAKSSQIYAI